MPKETIQDTVGTYDIRVGWSAAGGLQVGVETTAGFSLVSMLYGDPDCLDRIAGDVLDLALHQSAGLPVRAIGRRILDIVEASQASPGNPSYTGVWSTLDRASCNRLIKALRRGRDAAFGRDE